MISLDSIALRLRQAQTYQPALVDFLDKILRSGGRIGRFLNFSLWLSIVLGRRGIRFIRRLKGERACYAFSESNNPPPWLLPATVVASRHCGNRILIIAELSMSQCRKYRVEQKVMALEHLGFSASVLSWTDAIACTNALQTHGMVIFYRVPAFPGVKALLAEASRLGLTTFFDIDDLVFDLDEYARNKNVHSLPPAERELLLSGGALYREMLSLADHAIASTPVIADHMQKVCRGKVFLVENGLDKSLLQLAEEESRSTKARCSWIDIGYGSGTRTHDADFSVAAQALIEVLDHCPQVRLLIYGPLNIGNDFNRFGSRVLRIPFLRPDDYYRALARLDISLAPLENTVFNDAKSNIKFIEASVFGIPSVCSPAAAFRDVLHHGKNGFFASNPEEWRDILIKLSNDADLRHIIGNAAREAVLAHYSPAVLAKAQMLPVIRTGLASPSENKRRILVVNLLFAPISFGGATIVAEQLASGLQDCDNTEVLVFSGNTRDDLPPYTLRTYDWHGLPVVSMRLAQGGPREWDYQQLEAEQVFAEVLAAYRPDIVHFHSIQGMGASLAKACRAKNIPYVITLHDAWWLCERQFMVREDGNYCHQNGVLPSVCSSCVRDPAFNHHRYFYLRNILLGAHRLFAPSRFHQQLYIDSGLPEHLVKINKNGVLQPTHLPKKSRNNQLVFAYLGGRASHKGYFWLRDIMAKISGSNYVVKLVDIEQRFGLGVMASDSWTIGGQLEIVSPYEPSEIDSFFADIDVLLFPSQGKESFGLSVREALIRNIWVIATDCGGPSEDIVKGQNGDLLAMDDSEGYRQAIQRLIDKPELLDGYCNPYSGNIRTYPEQVAELSEHIDEILATTLQVSKSPIHCGHE